MTESRIDQQFYQGRRCHTCDRPVPKDFHWEALKCEECGGEGCQHEIEWEDDSGYKYQRRLCRVCKEERQELGYIELGERQ